MTVFKHGRTFRYDFWWHRHRFKSNRHQLCLEDARDVEWRISVDLASRNGKLVTVQGAVHIERIGVPSVACCGETDRTGVRTPTSDWSGRTNGFVTNWPNVNGS